MRSLNKCYPDDWPGCTSCLTGDYWLTDSLDQPASCRITIACCQSFRFKVPLQILGFAMNMYNTALYAYGDDVSLIQNLPKVKDDFCQDWIKTNPGPLLHQPQNVGGSSWRWSSVKHDFTNIFLDKTKFWPTLMRPFRSEGFENWSYSIQNIDGSSVLPCTLQFFVHHKFQCLDSFSCCKCTGITSSWNCTDMFAKNCTHLFSANCENLFSENWTIFQVIRHHGIDIKRTKVVESVDDL